MAARTPYSVSRTKDRQKLEMSHLPASVCASCAAARFLIIIIELSLNICSDKNVAHKTAIKMCNKTELKM